MVLMANWMRSVALLGLMACGPKAPPEFAGETTPVVLAAYQTMMESGDPQNAPEPFVSQLTTLLNRQGLKATILPIEQVPPGLEKRQVPAFRAAWLSETVGGDQPVVLVEASADYFSNLEGRYRWEVSVQTAVIDPSRPDEAVQKSFKVPVFLRFPHEDEVDALSQAAPLIERTLRRVLTDARLTD